MKHTLIKQKRTVLHVKYIEYSTIEDLHKIILFFFNKRENYEFIDAS